MKHALALLLLTGSLCWAGYGVEWTLPTGRGWPGVSFDVDRDNLPDVCVSYSADSLVFYSGASHARLWTIQNPHPENTYLGATSGNTGGDAWPELVVYGYHYTTSPTVYYYRFDIYDCASHQSLFSSPEMSSNLTVGIPYLADIDGDGRCEICVACGDSTARTLQVYGSSAAVQESPSPTHYGPRLSVIPSVSRIPVLVSGLAQSGSKVRIVDASGRVVRTLTLAGPGSILWDGTDDHSRPVPPGCYLVRADGQITKVITLP
jgi:hypothetical protein